MDKLTSDTCDALKELRSGLGDQALNPKIARLINRVYECHAHEMMFIEADLRDAMVQLKEAGLKFKRVLNADN